MKQLFLGNEALAQGAIDAGLSGVYAYPGTPSTEITEYIQKFEDIFKTADIKSVTTVVMEVPCCSGLPYIIKKGMEKAGKTIPMETVVISPRGHMLAQRVA